MKCMYFSESDTVEKVFNTSSYLSSRYQRVQCEDSVSELLPLTNGVPHGSI